MKLESIMDLVATMGGMKFFPTEPAVRLALCETIGDMTSSEERVRWLVKRMRTLYAEWPGEREMRACFCSRFRPLDGINLYSSVFLDGIPSENPPEQTFDLLASGAVPIDRQLGSMVKRLAEAKKL